MLSYRMENQSTQPWQFAQEELSEIISYYAVRGQHVTPEQIEKSVDDLVAIMLLAEEEFGITVTEELVSSWYADLPPELDLQSHAQA
jgi:hypothetical protein